MGRKQRTDRPGAEAADRPSTEPSASLPKDSTQHCHSTRSLTAHAAPKSRIGDKRRRHRQSSHPQAFFFLSVARAFLFFHLSLTGFLSRGFVFICSSLGSGVPFMLLQTPGCLILVAVGERLMDGLRRPSLLRSPSLLALHTLHCMMAHTPSNQPLFCTHSNQPLVHTSHMLQAQPSLFNNRSIAW